jgi:hypothetical protein
MMQLSLSALAGLGLFFGVGVLVARMVHARGAR